MIQTHRHFRRNTGRQLFIYFLSFCFCVPTFASEKEKAPEKPAAAQPEWLEIQNQLQNLKAKVSIKEKLIDDLFKQKRETKDPAKAHEAFEMIKKEYKELTQAVQDYEQKRSLLKYRFPEKGVTTQQRYRRLEAKSLEDMENKYSVDGKLRSAQEFIRKQYQVETKKYQKKAAPEKSEQAPSSVTEPSVVHK